ncbi:MAG: type III pantothenate kinase [Bacteroidetes bacterium]|nr:type III pantothenate kinase [Bacteroidota bacterium]
MRLAIDLGNTLAKAMFQDESFSSGAVMFEPENPLALMQVMESLPPSAAMISAVRDVPEALIETVSAYCPVHVLSHETPLPFSIEYETPETLGRDRIAAVAAAYARFPGCNVLVIDMGTCITYDLLTADGRYLGGAISPGIAMRLKAMHTFTSRLPLAGISPEAPLVGQTTHQSLLSGAVNGTRAELEGMIRRYEKTVGKLTVLVGGGDNKYFETKFKSRIFAASNLVLEGLQAIMKFNKIG